ncbi:MAG: hypothetical protein WC824_07845 [Bacteroidota bacterium]
MNRLLIEREDFWNELPVHVIEAEIDFERPLVIPLVTSPKTGKKEKCYSRGWNSPPRMTTGKL